MKSLKKQLSVCIILPLLALGAVVIIISLTVVRNALLDEVKTSLKAAAVTTLAAYDQNSGDYLQTDNGDVWKGSYNISASGPLLDSIKERSGMEVTFFYGDSRIMTSSFDQNGYRVLGSKAGSKITEKVLNEGKEYFSELVSIEGKQYFGYYIPVYQNGDLEHTKPIGMVFTGTDKHSKLRDIQAIIIIMFVGVILSILIFGINARFFISRLIRSINDSIGKVHSVADGNLRLEFDAKSLNRKDEIGDLSHSIQSLQQKLTEMVQEIDQNISRLLTHSDVLETTASETTQQVNSITDAVNSIASSATEQAQQVQDANENVQTMGGLITDTVEKVHVLNESADNMHTGSETASQTLSALSEISNDVSVAVQMISDQTTQTHTAAMQIHEATSFIAEIADETNLLALNASIEAARAGEAGRGFAVVASQIQSLADQSNNASGKIEQIVTTLIHDSEEAVNKMKQVEEVISRQNLHMTNTETAVENVMKEIQISVNQIQDIADKTQQIEQLRNKLVDVISSLSAISQENAATTEEANASMYEIRQSFSHVGESADTMKEIAAQLSDNIKHFNL